MWAYIDKEHGPELMVYVECANVGNLEVYSLFMKC